MIINSKLTSSRFTALRLVSDRDTLSCHPSDISAFLLILSIFTPVIFLSFSENNEPILFVTVPPNSMHAGWTLPPNNTLVGRTVPPNNTHVGGTPKETKSYHSVSQYHIEYVVPKSKKRKWINSFRKFYPLILLFRWLTYINFTNNTHIEHDYNPLHQWTSSRFDVALLTLLCEAYEIRWDFIIALEQEWQQ